MSSSGDMTPGSEGPLRLFLRSAFFAKELPVPSDLDLSDRTALVTGGNGGLGLECARILLAHNLARVIITARDEKKGEVAGVALRKEYPGATVEVWSLDLASYESTQGFAKRCASLDRLDITILNAGLATFRHETSPSTKHELTLQVNHLSTALLAILLLPIIREKRLPKEPSRLSIVSSGLAYATGFPEQDSQPLFSAFDDPKQFNMDRYATTKLLELMFVTKLKDIVSAEEVVVNCVDPGFIGGSGGATDLHRGMPFPVRAMFGLMKLTTGRSLKAGASTYVTAAAVLGKESHGSFIFDWSISPFPKIMYSAKGEKLIDQLWTETLDELQFAGVREILGSMSAEKL